MNIFDNLTTGQFTALMIFTSLILYLIFVIVRLVVEYFKTRSKMKNKSNVGIDSLPEHWLRPYDDEHLGI